MLIKNFTGNIKNRIVAAYPCAEDIPPIFGCIKTNNEQNNGSKNYCNWDEPQKMRLLVSSKIKNSAHFIH